MSGVGLCVFLGMFFVLFVFGLWYNFRLITVCQLCHTGKAARMGPFTPRLLMGSQCSTQQKFVPFLSGCLQNCVRRIKLQVQTFRWRHTRTRLDTGFEPDEILISHGTVYVTLCPEVSFSSATSRQYVFFKLCKYVCYKQLGWLPSAFWSNLLASFTVNLVLFSYTLPMKTWCAYIYLVLSIAYVAIWV